VGVVTLLTDFGIQDGYTGIMKGVIWNIAPGVQIADLSHNILPQDILGAALLLERAFPYFPDGAVHLVVVDPGVGTSRRPIAAFLGRAFFVGPDNGLLSFVLRRSEAEHQKIEIVHLDRPQFWLHTISQSFHGRDIFAPCAAHLAAGIPLKEMGTVIQDPVLIDFPGAQITPQGYRGQVLHIDHFGNLATNIAAGQLPAGKRVVVSIGGRKIVGLSATYADAPPGELVAMIDSAGWLSIARVNGNAADALGAQAGDNVDVWLDD